ncbi:hypothetical protein [Plantactinospora sp. GCM10030261]|uniref:hypothetical protein n=1 Tax=Plantactinospora sp. GCM10030261 TaxID=3273420 RepID=UPI0036243620
MAIYLAALFIDAVRELPDRPVTELYARFFAVLRRERPAESQARLWVRRAYGGP